MSKINELHRLIINNLQVLEKAPSEVSTIEQKVFYEMNSIIRSWVESNEKWDGVYTYLCESNEAETTFRPTTGFWGETDEKGYWRNYYTIDTIDSNSTPCVNKISALVGASATRIGISFNTSSYWITRCNNKRCSKPSSAWRKYLANQFAEKKLSEFGFELQEETIFLPIMVDAELLSNSYPNSINEALFDVVNNALKKIGEAHNLINQIINEGVENNFEQIL